MSGAARIVEMLRNWEADRNLDKTMRDAADEIERLQTENERLKSENARLDSNWNVAHKELEQAKADIPGLDRESIMQKWDTWRRAIASGAEGSWPRDAFESLLDAYDEGVLQKLCVLERCLSRHKKSPL